jgi:hypothetical protein
MPGPRSADKSLFASFSSEKEDSSLGFLAGKPSNFNVLVFWR